MNQEQIAQIHEEANAYATLQTTVYADWLPIRNQKFAELVAAVEQARCCRLIFGHCSSDNVAQRTVDAIKRGDK